LADEADDVFFIVGVVGVAGDAAALVDADLVLIDDPIEAAAVAEAVVSKNSGGILASVSESLTLSWVLSLDSRIFSTW
jgi:hypothetical protein